MKLAVISDVHGNYPALAKVIEDAVTYGVDRFVFIGDYIFDLPYSDEVVREIRKLDNAYVIAGNKEGYLKELSKQDQRDWVYNQMGAVYQTYRELSGEVMEYLLGLEENCYVPLSSGKMLYATHFFDGIITSKTKCSSSDYHRRMLLKPFTHEEFLSDFDELINQDTFRNAIDQINASVIVFGHNHLQGYGYCDGKLVVNPGSCGQPLDFNIDAAYSIVEETACGFNVIERRVAYDIESVISHAERSEVCQHGKIWSELVFLAMRTGRDWFGMFFKIAREIASAKGEKGQFFSNETWEETYLRFTAQHK